MNKYNDTRLADYAFQCGNYYTAIDIYLKLYNNELLNPYFSYQLAESYSNIRDYYNAEVFYLKTLSCSSDEYPLARYKYAKMQKLNGEYQEAIKTFSEIKKEIRNVDNAVYVNDAIKEIKDCDFAMKSIESPLPVYIEKLDTGINKANSDFAPVIYNNNLIFSSLRSDSKVELDKNFKSDEFVKLYYANSRNGKVEEFSKGFFNGNDIHTANGAFSPDKKRFYYTQCNLNENNKAVCSIYVSSLKNDKWSNPVSLDEEINLPGFTNTQPCVGKDKKTKNEVLYFVSDRPGGIGGSDIWYSIITNGNEYSTPLNIGTRINTPENEMTPYYADNTGILYFSSNGMKSYGGFDIYEAEGSMDKWKKSENIGYPLNSSVDDIYYIPPDARGQGYFVSNRKYGNNENTCCDDIYRFIWLDSIKIIVTGHIYDSLKNTIDSAKIVFYTENDTNTISRILPKDKTYWFKLKPDKKYRLHASHPDYIDSYNELNTLNMYVNDTIYMDFVLKQIKVEKISEIAKIENVENIEKGKAYTLNNIYFDFDKADLRSQSMQELDHVVELIKKMPNSVIEISAHTDSVASFEYNMDLSERRAKSVVRYLVEKGISQEQLKAKGYGETMPVAPNTVDGKDYPEGRQLNRRIEFKIVGEIKPETETNDKPDNNADNKN